MDAARECVCVLCKILVTMKSKWREHDITIQLGLCAKVSAFYFSERAAARGYSTMRHTHHAFLHRGDLFLYT
jgi:hypothetical protein